MSMNKYLKRFLKWLNTWDKNNEFLMGSRGRYKNEKTV